MKLWFPPRTMFNYPNSNRPILSHTLHLRHFNRIFISSPHLSRRKLRMANPQHPRQWGIILLHLHLHAHRPRPLLWVIPLQGNLKHRRGPSSTSYDNSLRWLCAPMRPNVLLRRHSYHKSSICCTIHRGHASSMNLRRILGRQRDTNTVLRIPLPTTIHHCRRNYPSPSFPP